MIGSYLMRGVKSNLNSLYEKKCRENNLNTIKNQSDLDIENAIDLYFRSEVSGDFIPNNATKAINLWKKWFQNKIGNSTQCLIKNINNPFNNIILVL